MTKQSIGCLFALIAMAACASVEGDPGSTGGMTGSSDSGGSGSGSSDGTPHDGSGACPQPDGPRHSYSTQDEVTALITGIWVHCAGPTPTSFEGSIGVDINADGNYYKLVSDGHGGMVRDTGFSAQGTWDVRTTPSVPGEPHDLVSLEFWISPSSEVLDTPLFEDNPRRFAFDQAHTLDFAIYQIVKP